MELQRCSSAKLTALGFDSHIKWTVYASFDTSSEQNFLITSEEERTSSVKSVKNRAKLYLDYDKEAII